METKICYEQPLNERVRLLLRLEFLFQQIAFAAARPSAWDTRDALQGLQDILNITYRNEFKSELRKELERHVAALNRLRAQQGDINLQALETIIDELQKSSWSISNLDNPALEAVRKNEFLSAIRQRSSIPGGTCAFDLPALHHWLQRDIQIRTRHLDEWLRPFRPIQIAVDLLLRLIRDSATSTWETAVGGFFQKVLDSNAPSQLVRVQLPADALVFPEISGGKHRFSIRFMEQADPNQKAVQNGRDVEFELTCCVI